MNNSLSDSIIKMTKREGWKVPGVEQSVISLERKEFKFDDSINRNIFVTILKPKDNIQFVPSAPSSHQPVDKYAIKLIRQFDFKNQIFCYEIFASRIKTDIASGDDKSTLEMSSFLYYDRDGDRIFETFEWGNTSTVEQGPPIPSWVSKDK